MCSALDSRTVGGGKKKNDEKKKISDLGYCSSRGGKENKTCRIAPRIFNGVTKLFCLCETSPSADNAHGEELIIYRARVQKQSRCR